MCQSALRYAQILLIAMAGHKNMLTHLFGAAFKHYILLALVQPPLPHGPEVKHSVLPLQQLIQDV